MRLVINKDTIKPITYQEDQNEEKVDWSSEIVDYEEEIEENEN